MLIHWCPVYCILLCVCRSFQGYRSIRVCRFPRCESRHRWYNFRQDTLLLCFWFLMLGRVSMLYQKLCFIIFYSADRLLTCKNCKVLKLCTMLIAIWYDETAVNRSDQPCQACQNRTKTALTEIQILANEDYAASSS